MNARFQSPSQLCFIALLMVIGQGCGSHAVKYTVDSESLQEKAEVTETASEVSDGTGMNPSYLSGRTFQEGGQAYDPGIVGAASPYLSAPGTVGQPAAKEFAMTSPYTGLQYFEPGEGPWGEGADYGHQYEGVPGSGPSYGGVSGFGHGSAEGVHPDPDKWAEAYIRENGGMMPEHVGEDMMIAKAAPSGSFADPNGSAYEGHGTTSEFERSRGLSRDGRTSYASSVNNGTIEDVYFDFDSWRITRTGARALESDAEWLRQNPQTAVTIEGHCDQRGTQDYNLVLGKKRAESAKAYLIDLGIQPHRLKIVSYGEERPFCQGTGESCYRQNRRSHIVVRSN